MLRRLLALCLLSVSPAMATTFTANLKSYGPGVPKVFVRLTVRGCDLNGMHLLPQVSGSGVFVGDDTGKDAAVLFPDANGLIFATVQDSSTYTCGGVTGNAYYHLELWSGSQTTPLNRNKLREADYDITGSSFDLATATPKATITPATYGGNATTLMGRGINCPSPSDQDVLLIDIGSGQWQCGMNGGAGNALSIRGVTVDTTSPANNQAPVYDTASSKYVPKSVVLATGIKYASDFSWTQSPTVPSSLTGSSSATVGLAPCPVGLELTSGKYSVYIAGTGTPEVVIPSGGTCTSGASSGTIIFTPANSHSTGYTISSSSSGLVEGINAGNITGNGGKIIVPPATYTVYGRASIVSATNVTIDMTGAIISCALLTTTDDCIQIESTSSGVAIINPRGEPTANANSLIHITSAQKTVVRNPTFFSSGGTNVFLHGVQVDNDQTFIIDGLSLDTNSSRNAFKCSSASACSSVIYNPSGTSNAASGLILASNINCAGRCNGIDWQGGNTLGMIGGYLQGYNQFGFRGKVTATGGSGRWTFTGVHNEAGNATDPLTNGDMAAGYLSEGGAPSFGGSRIRIDGGKNGGGRLRIFTTNGTAGSTRYDYYVIAIDGSSNKSAPMLAGNLTTGNATIDGTNSINVIFPPIPSASGGCDVLRVNVTASGSPNVPIGTAANLAVATGLTCNGSSAVTVTDTTTSPSSYTVPYPSTWFPDVPLWSGSVVLGGKDQTSATSLTRLQGNILSSLSIVQTGLPDIGSIPDAIQVTGQVSFGGQTTPIPPSTWNGFGLYRAAGTVPTNAFLLPYNIASGGTGSNLTKGVLNLGNSSPGDKYGLITFYDDDFGNTIGDFRHRPTITTTGGTHLVRANGGRLVWLLGAGMDWYIAANPDGSTTDYLMHFDANGLQLKPTTVSALGTCNSGAEGKVRGVTDANSTTFNATATGGGSNHMAVRCNGSNWVIY